MDACGLWLLTTQDSAVSKLSVIRQALDEGLQAIRGLHIDGSAYTACMTSKQQWGRSIHVLPACSLLDLLSDDGHSAQGLIRSG